MSNDFWKDCFGRRLVKGADVVYARNVERLESGIVHEITDEYVEMSYNMWTEDGIEKVRTKRFTINKYPNKEITRIYQIYSIA